MVWQVGDPGTPTYSTLDPAILRWCETHAFILVTNNRRSMPRHLQDHIKEGRHMPGIFELHPNVGIGDAIAELHLIWEASNLTEYRDTIVYLPLA